LGFLHPAPNAFFVSLVETVAMSRRCAMRDPFSLPLSTTNVGRGADFARIDPVGQTTLIVYLKVIRRAVWDNVADLTQCLRIY
jgi:hypothetical protein